MEMQMSPAQTPEDSGDQASKQRAEAIRKLKQAITPDPGKYITLEDLKAWWDSLTDEQRTNPDFVAYKDTEKLRINTVTAHFAKLREERARQAKAGAAEAQRSIKQAKEWHRNISAERDRRNAERAAQTQRDAETNVAAVAGETSTEIETRPNPGEPGAKDNQGEAQLLSENEALKAALAAERAERAERAAEQAAQTAVINTLRGEMAEVRKALAAMGVALEKLQTDKSNEQSVRIRRTAEDGVANEDYDDEDSSTPESTPELKITRVISRTRKHTVSEAKDQYGNLYVIKEALRGSVDHERAILKKFTGDAEFVELVESQGNELIMQQEPGTVSITTLRKGTQLTEEQNVDIARQVVAAHLKLAKRGIAQFDVSPDSVLLVPDREKTSGYRVVICDFDMAREIGELAGSATNDDRVTNSLSIGNMEEVRQLGLTKVSHIAPDVMNEQGYTYQTIPQHVTLTIADILLGERLKTGADSNVSKLPKSVSEWVMKSLSTDDSKRYMDLESWACDFGAKVLMTSEEMRAYATLRDTAPSSEDLQKALKTIGDSSCYQLMTVVKSRMESEEASGNKGVSTECEKTITLLKKKNPEKLYQLLSSATHRMQRFRDSIGRTRFKNPINDEMEEIEKFTNDDTIPSYNKAALVFPFLMKCISSNLGEMQYYDQSQYNNHKYYKEELMELQKSLLKELILDPGFSGFRDVWTPADIFTLAIRKFLTLEEANQHTLAALNRTENEELTVEDCATIEQFFRQNQSHPGLHDLVMLVERFGTGESAAEAMMTCNNQAQMKRLAEQLFQEVNTNYDQKKVQMLAVFSRKDSVFSYEQLMRFMIDTGKTDDLSMFAQERMENFTWDTVLSVVIAMGKEEAERDGTIEKTTRWFFWEGDRKDWRFTFPDKYKAQLTTIMKNLRTEIEKTKNPKLLSWEIEAELDKITERASSDIRTSYADLSNAYNLASSQSRR